MKSTNIKGSFVIQDKLGRGTHFSKLVDLESPDIEVYQNVLKTLSSGASCDVDLGDVKDGKTVILSGTGKFEAVINSKKVKAEFLMLWDSEVETISINEIEGATNKVRVIVCGNTTKEE